jgi:hypothetical protein
MKHFLFFLMLLAPLVFAQSTISGTLYANDIQGFVIFACFFDAATSDCNYDKSSYVKVNQNGSYSLESLETGDYIIIAWKDSNANGVLDEGQDEVAYYTDANGTPALIVPPASGIDLQVEGLAVSQPDPNPLGSDFNPLSQTPAQNPPTTSTNTTATDVTPTGNFPAEYVGVWVDNTAAYGFSITGGGWTGNPQILTMSGAFNSGGRVLKIAGDGSYTFYEGDANGDCFNTITSQGVVGIDGATFTLYPTTKREAQADMGQDKFSNCETFEHEVTPAPESYPLEFRESDGLYGWKTYELSLLADNEYWVFQKLKGTLPPMPEAQPLPGNFIVGTDIMYNELVGRWFASGDDEFRPPEERIPVDFYDAATGTLDADDYASSLTFANDGTYELVVYRANLLYVPICTKNVLLLERGTTKFVINSRDDYTNKYVSGDVVLTPTASTLTDEIINCDNDNARETISLPLNPRYLTWKLEMPNTLTGQASPEDTFAFFCPSEYTNERTEWLFMYCPSEVDQSNRYQRR